MAKSLAERANSLRGPRATITDLEAWITDATAERDSMSAAAVAASAESVDFRFTEEERDEAAAKSERYSRTAKALDGAIAELTAILEEKRSSTAQKAKAELEAAVIAERDALAERLRSEWPGIEATILELLDGIKANNARIQELRLAELGAEQVARNCGPMVGVGGGPRSLTEMRLPSFTDAHRLAWPRPSTFNPDLHRPQMLTEKKRMEEERAKWRRYLITPGAGEPPSVRLKNDRKRVLREPLIAVLSPELVEEARAQGCIVVPAAANLSVGGVVQASF